MDLVIVTFIQTIFIVFIYMALGTAFVLLYRDKVFSSALVNSLIDNDLGFLIITSWPILLPIFLLQTLWKVLTCR